MDHVPPIQSTGLPLSKSERTLTEDDAQTCRLQANSLPCGCSDNLPYTLEFLSVQLIIHIDRQMYVHAKL